MIRPNFPGEFFRYHLNAPYIDNVPEVYTVSLLDHLDKANYYDPNCLHDGERVNVVRRAIDEVLLWLVKRKHVILFIFGKPSLLIHFMRIQMANVVLSHMTTLTSL